ncbi:MAG: xanthine dehydrogenase family protein molybdopterin-binding subunit [Dehalococcoidia bacterium]
MAQTYIGASIRRTEDFRLVTGTGSYVDDIKIPGVLHAAILRSPHGHARIKSIDTAKAVNVPGVVAVFTYADLAPSIKPIPIRMVPLPGLERYLQYPLASGIVRYVGEPVAIVVAESRYLAEDALDAIEVMYEPLAAVVNVKESLKNEVVIHQDSGTNLAASYTVSRGDVEEAFNKADYTSKEEFKVHRHTGNPMETRGLVASYDPHTEDLTVWGPTKVPHFNRRVLSSLLDMPVERVHFIEPDVGGGFGVRGEFYPEDFLIPFSATKLRRPVKWIEDRREHLMVTNHSREMLFEVEVAAQRDGTILGIRAKIFADIGAYSRPHGGLVPTHAAKWLPGPFRVPDYHCEVYLVVTNKNGIGTYRAPAPMNHASPANGCWTWSLRTSSLTRGRSASRTSFSHRKCPTMQEPWTRPKSR